MRNEFSDIRTLVVSALGLSVTIWDIAFNLGVHGTVFYNKLMTLWIASTVVLLCVWFAGKGVHSVGRLGTAALLSPTIWFILNALTPRVNISWFEGMLWIMALITFAIAIPYILYILFELVENDFFSLSPYHRNRLIGIVLFVSLMGYLVGTLHPYFVSCEQFNVAGDHAPDNCVEW